MNLEDENENTPEQPLQGVRININSLFILHGLML